MITEPVTISPAGQLVLPKAVRTLLNTRQIAFEIIEDTITIKPLNSLRGSLAAYHKSEGDFATQREQVWMESIDEK